MDVVERDYANGIANYAEMLDMGELPELTRSGEEYSKAMRLDAASPTADKE